MRFFPKLSAFGKVVAGLGLGILTGIFFGDLVGFLSVGGDIYIRLLQMTVLPYILVSLIGGLGRLDASTAAKIGARSGLLILAIWGTTLLVLCVMPLAYPDWTAAAFFSTSLVSAPPPFDPLQLYVPSNPFHALSNTIVPAVVVFAACMGIALIAVPEKAGLLKALDNVAQALMKIASTVAKTAPYGIFAISAAAAGTLRVEELGRLQVYLWTYLAAWLVLAVVVLPSLVAWGTNLSYRQVIRVARTPMITGFAVGTVLVVIPMIVERCHELLKEKGVEGDDVDATVEVLAPTAYSFPSAGTLLGLGFILFAAWFVGTELELVQLPTFAVVGALSAFGTMAVALPFMLDFFRLPTDLFQLYLLGSVVTMRFATALAAMHGVVICLLGAYAITDRLSWRRVLQIGAAGAGIAGATLLVLGAVLTRAIPYEYAGYQTFVSMQLMNPPVTTRQHDSLPPLALDERSRDRLSVILDRGSLRVGYLADRLPFAFRNEESNVVGFDMDLVHSMAADLDVSLDIVRLEKVNAAAALNQGIVDMVVGGIVATPELAEMVAFSRSYLDETLAFLVEDHRRNDFRGVQRLRNTQGLRIAVPGPKSFEHLLQRLLPNVEVVRIESPREFLRGDLEGIDAMAFAAETGAAWTLVYPDFSVVVTRGIEAKAPVAFALPTSDVRLQAYVDTWLELSDKNDSIDKVFRHWILGQDDTTLERRWSVIRNVLGLVE